MSRPTDPAWKVLPPVIQGFFFSWPYPLVIPERQVEFAQFCKYHHQSDKAASAKLQGVQEFFYTQKCKILRFFITIKTIEFGILINLNDRAVLLAFWKILNQGNWQNKTENTWHYVKRVISCILIDVGKEGFISYSA